MQSERGWKEWVWENMQWDLLDEGFSRVLQFILRLNCNMLTPLLVSMVLTEVV